MKSMQQAMLWGMVIGITITMAQSVQAQLFGQRSLGQTLGPSGGAGAERLGAMSANNLSGASAGAVGSNAGGTIRGAERFLRANRDGTAFVGSDRKDTDFVGSEQSMGKGNVRAATESLQELGSKRGARNPPVPPLPKKSLYYPRLVLDDSIWDDSMSDGASGSNLSSTGGSNSSRSPRRSNASLDSGSLQALQQRVADQSRGQARLEVQGRKAVLVGRVESQRMAELLAIQVSFTPGIDQVQNDLRIAP